MLVKDDLHAEITKALQSATRRTEVVEDQVATARFETQALNSRMLGAETRHVIEYNRVRELETEVGN